MNLPNKLTLARLLLTIAFLCFFFSSLPWRDTPALAVFLIASITDLYDGRIARRHGLITNFGILMDPLADKILVCSAFIAFVGRQLMPAWMVVLIVGREFTITGLRLLAASKHIVLAAEGFGKHKTVSQFVAIIAILVQTSHTQWGEWALRLFNIPILGAPWVDQAAELAKWVAVFFTGLSGAVYLWRNRHIYLEEL